MEPYILSLFLDIVLAGLLAGVIWYGFRLNRQLSALRQSREELKALLEDFAKSTDRAEAALDSLKRGARENIAAVKQTVDKADSIKDDLVFLTKRGEQTADRLEAGITDGRSKAEAPARGRSARTSGGKEARGGKEVGTASRDLSAGDPSDDPSGGPTGAPTGGGKAKKKSDLLKALQGMR